MINKTITRLFIVFFVLIIFSGCKKLVEIDGPKYQLVDEKVFENDASATAAMMDVYIQVLNLTANFSRGFAILSDELKNFSTDRENTKFYENNLIAADDHYYNAAPWVLAYKSVYEVNALTEGLERFSGVSEPVKKQLIGEAKFARAFWYFYLVNCYGDVPLVLSTDYKINARISRSSASDVYIQIVKDLKDAENNLNENYVDLSGFISTNQKLRPNRSTASALLARVYLYTKDFENAAITATNVITSNANYILENSLDSVFLADSREAIWQITVPEPSGGNQTLDGQYFILRSSPVGNYPANTAVSTQLLNSFEAGDLRRKEWIDSLTVPDPIDTFRFPYKYHVDYADYNLDNRKEYTTVLRLAEQYLIRAEANAQLDKLTDAVNDLNVIRHRAGLPDYPGSIDKPAILNAILHERQVELFTEWGHRWFDLIRMNKIDEVMGAPGNVTASKGGAWEPYKSLFPIPQSEILIDNNLTQNPGY